MGFCCKVNYTVDLEFPEYFLHSMLITYICSLEKVTFPAVTGIDFFEIFKVSGIG